MDLRSRSRFICAILASVFILPNFSFAQDDIISFYPKAYAKTQNPPEEKKLMVIAEQKIEDKFVTFMGVEKGKVLLAAITKENLKEPSKDIILKIKFKNIEKEIQHLTVPYSDTNKIIEWSYIFDRNNDGKIDYVAYLSAAIPIKPQQIFPPDFPKGQELTDHFVALIKEYRQNPQYLYMFWLCLRLVFDHMADDNFDGKIDATIIEAMDSERYWVDRWMVLRCTQFDERVDTCWQFRDSIQVKERGCLRLGKGYWTHRAGLREKEFGSEQVAKMNGTLSLLNQAANLCGLTKDSFYKE